MSAEIYIKFYVDAVRSGMVADMGAERLQTLLVIASFMNEKGECYPTQWQIAKALGVARETANRRVMRLAKYRWEGKPLIELRKIRNDMREWVKIIYKILPVSNVSIFK
ncbi:helix-turn-helix domain-containing protein [Paenibacillus larvae]|uniref:DNA binding-like protein n=1 Tax=Paenibacillus phage Tripp TaxID=1718161 RepID=A0A0N7GFE9_9CAUD|nr:helix-turn-helix domain-containing protein [Paenibacillus larvae]YP_009210564.1 DNA binding protein [Paenibacillus phage Tripp]ALH46417.1 DNA binding-like protein [Paenibacillus phage Tripp]ETK28026.1 hypothetical protein ERIC1_1c14810 [Paenibacillus larvae subsp. larvae DSM 25719]MDT2294000.1 helix-turn-helix domain-containing protein [Paenibacillus larvae]